MSTETNAAAEPMTVTLVPYDGRALGELLREIETLPEYRIDNKPLIRIHDALADLHYGWVGYQPSDDAADAARFRRYFGKNSAAWRDGIDRRIDTDRAARAQEGGL